MKQPIRYLLIALGLLTQIPVNFKKKLTFEDRDVAKATLFFPLIGFIIGGFLFFIYLIFSNILPSKIVSLSILGGWIYLTGALHIDGLVDTVDGLCGGKNKKEILRIMEDSSVGAKGAVAVVFLILIKFFLIEHVILSAKLQNLVYAPVLSRWGIVLSCYFLPYAKKDGMGSFASFLDFSQIAGATLITVILGVFLLGGFFLIPLAVIAVFSLGWSFYLKRKIGGFTGDTLGALNEMGEVLVLLTGI